ncbi:hypothetical protein K469DRAFT_322452 [Zopfia rhizophila CBS 207.26]|uniref:60S ribosomal subunit assembly/export protein LOC1 n=1 Tax=Zopfia rhizophila CBS 207.26 TaxID=1314779 RepID=A0A6A6DLK6_9PEZI|nr:hypothetical protein K469DRAFT_322452 [Zopfia rhizophila CBS 207.26]
MRGWLSSIRQDIGEFRFRFRLSSKKVSTAENFSKVHQFAMAPTKSSKAKRTSGRAAGSVSKKSVKPPGASSGGISKRKAKNLTLAKPGGAQKTKSKPTDNKKKKRIYTEKELDIPKLNGIIPAGVQKPKGQKKGKKFVDDPESMMAIMSVVNAEKEGHLESKIMRARQLEEVREAKRREQEARSEEKKAKFVSILRGRFA